MVRSYSKIRERNEPPAKFRKGLRVLTVRVRPGFRSQGLLNAGGTVYPCALGSGGVTIRKREGDGATPLSSMRLLGGYFRRGSFQIRTLLPLRPLTPTLGWCEVPDDRNYNRPVRMPYAASHERMLRDDHLYDACLVLDWNIRPRRRGCGSAIFFHLSRPGYSPTRGCIAVSRQTMARLLPRLTRRTVVKVVR